MVMIEHIGRIVKDVAVDLTKGYHSLERMTKRMLSSDQYRHGKGKRTPADLYARTSVPFF